MVFLKGQLNTNNTTVKSMAQPASPFLIVHVTDAIFFNRKKLNNGNTKKKKTLHT
jgi:hypothetical protein